MTWRDKLELGLKDDAAFRKDNLPPRQIRGPEISTGPGRSPEIPLARGDQTEIPAAAPARPFKRRGKARMRSGAAKRRA